MADAMKAPERPPKLAERIFGRLLREEDRGPMLGDAAEEYAQLAARHGITSARRWYWRQLAASVLPALRRRLTRPTIGISMIDIKLGVRMLGKQPILTVVAGLTLALGIPAALFPTHLISTMDSDLPVDEPDRVLGLRNWNTRENRNSPQLLHDFAVWREELTSFEALGAARSDPWNVHSPDGRAAEVRGAEMTASVFSILRVPPLVGRTLLPADEVEGAPDVVVISEDLWESRFARDPRIVGTTIGIGRRPHTVVGVMPAGFYFPIRDFLWIPLRADPADYAVGEGPDLFVIGRLADGASVADANEELAVVSARLRAEWPETHEALRSEALSYSLTAMGELEGVPGSWEFILVQLFSFGLLAVACGNVGTLILARTATRLNEISVRTALGASRARILSQLFAESLVLALGATAVGLVIAQTLIEVVANRLLNSDLPYWLDLDLTPRMIVLALGLGAACAVLAGVLPAMKATSPRIQRSLQAHTRGATVRFGSLTTALIVAEVALSVGFLCFGTAAFLSFMRDRSGDAGLDLDRYLVAELRTPWVEPTAAEADTYEATFQRRAAANQDELLARLAAEADVRHVAMGAQVPGDSHPIRRVTIEGVPNPTPIEVRDARVHFDYFRGMGIDVLRGRAFTAADAEIPDAVQRRAVVVNDQFVDDVFGGGDAVGRLIRLDERDGPYEIVGVVETFGTNLQTPSHAAAVYHPMSSADVFMRFRGTGGNIPDPMSYLIEVDGSATSFIPRLRSIAAAVDPDAIVESPRSVAELAARQRIELRTVTLLIFTLSAVGMMLAATGLYALMSFTVSQRTREIGIRAALGANAHDVIATVARKALAQLMSGVLLGSVLGWVFVRQNAGTFAIDSVPLLVAGVATAVVVFSALSCLPPIRRGLRIQPTEALREA